MTESPDRLARFLLPEAGVRGVHVQLTDSWREILANGSYRPATLRVLGEACVASALFTGHVKIDGRLSIQLRSSSTLRALFAECTAAGTLRGIAQVEEGQDAPADLAQLGDGALLAITIENPGLDPREPQRYQSLVALQGNSLDEAFEDYFRHSEQLPTRLLLAANGEQAAGLLLQKLPGDQGDDDGWTRAGALFDTLGRDELLAVDGSQLLHRLFHEEHPETMGEKELRFGCSCSRERVVGMLQSLGEDEARAAAEASGSGQVEVRCEFCGREYRFPPAEFSVLFEDEPATQPAPDRLQ